MTSSNKKTEPRKHDAREGEAPAEPLAPDEPLALPSRRHPVHGIKYVDGQPTIIFDTICTKGRVPVLACDDFHRIFRTVLSDATAWLMGRYVIMPDHIHFFAADVDSEIPYENWVTYIKSQLTKQFRAHLRETTPGGRGTGGRGGNLGGRGSRRAVDSRQATDQLGSAGASPSPAAGFRWQTDHWDTRMRDFQSYEEKWIYMLDNPVRAGLVARAQDWPYRGEIFPLRWD